MAEMIGFLVVVGFLVIPLLFIGALVVLLLRSARARSRWLSDKVAHEEALAAELAERGVPATVTVRRKVRGVATPWGRFHQRTYRRRTAVTPRPLPEYVAVDVDIVRDDSPDSPASVRITRLFEAYATAREGASYRGLVDPADPSRVVVDWAMPLTGA